MIVGFTGTRSGMSQEQANFVKELIKSLRPDEVHHGDCVGSDALFSYICSQWPDLEIHVHPPENEKFRAYTDGIIHDPKPYMERNQDIVNASDILIATPDGQEVKRGSGTWATVRRARQKDIPIYIIYPDGSSKIPGKSGVVSAPQTC